MAVQIAPHYATEVALLGQLTLWRRLPLKDTVGGGRLGGERRDRSGLHVGHEVGRCRPREVTAGASEVCVGDDHVVHCIQSHVGVRRARTGVMEVDHLWPRTQVVLWASSAKARAADKSAERGMPTTRR